MWKTKKIKKNIDDEANRFFLSNFPYFTKKCHLFVVFLDTSFITALVRGKWNKLSDGTSKKNVIWEDIAEEMNTNGIKQVQAISPVSIAHRNGTIC